MNSKIIKIKCLSVPYVALNCLVITLFGVIVFYLPSYINQFCLKYFKQWPKSISSLDCFVPWACGLFLASLHMFCFPFWFFILSKMIQVCFILLLCWYFIRLFCTASISVWLSSHYLFCATPSWIDLCSSLPLGIKMLQSLDLIFKISNWKTPKSFTWKSICGKLDL